MDYNILPMPTEFRV